MDHALSHSHVIPSPYLMEVCKYRQGSECCKYIVFFDDFYCAKKSELKEKIDMQEMNAKGDNCQGLPDEKTQDGEGCEG